MRQHTDIKDCYGVKNNKLQKCCVCKYLSYCQEASYPTPTRNFLDLSELKDHKKYEIKNIHTEKSTLINLFSELLFQIQDVESAMQFFIMSEKFKEILRTNQKTFKVVLIKLRHPWKSYQDIANDLDCDKQLIAYHLKRAQEIYPELNQAIAVDKTRYPKSMLHKK